MRDGWAGEDVMRIFALVTDAFGGHGGIARFNRELLSALCSHPDVEQVVALPRLLPEPPGDLPEKLVFDTSGVGGKLKFVLAVLHSAFRTPRSAIILCGHIHLLPVAFLIRLFRRVPIVLVVHGVDAWQPTRRWLVDRLVRKIDVLISVSDFTRQRFLAWARPVRAQRFRLPNCVDLTAFTPGPKHPGLMERYGLRESTVLLTVARLSAQERYKGVDEVLAVLPELAREIPNLRYLVVGDGTDRARLVQKAASLGLADRVRFAGYVAEREKVDHYRLADAFVMAGWGEGFGIVYLEALACGVPVLASKLDASREAVLDGKLGVLVNPKSPAELRAGILRVLRERPRGVPAELNHFDRDHFRARCGEIFSTIGAGQGGPSR
jgi:phosphatidyl-myo-inositol dimannoside synthase